MKPWCVGHHCVIIQSLHHHPIMCMHHGLWIVVCIMVCMINDVCVVAEGDWWHLWLVAWLCHPHVCLFVIHHKWYSPHIPIFCSTAPNWMARGPGDLPSCIGWLFCDHSFSLSNHNCLLFFLKSSLFFSNPLHHGCFEMFFGVNLIEPTNYSSSFILFQFLMF